MVPQVVLDEGGDEEVGMVIAILHAQLHRLTARLRGCDERLRLQLLLKKAVRRALVDEDVAPRPGVALQQLARVVGLEQAI